MFWKCMESQAKTQVVFQAKTQAQTFPIESLPRFKTQKENERQERLLLSGESMHWAQRTHVLSTGPKKHMTRSQIFSSLHSNVFTCVWFLHNLPFSLKILFRSEIRSRFWQWHMTTTNPFYSRRLDSSCPAGKAGKMVNPVRALRTGFVAKQNKTKTENWISLEELKSFWNISVDLQDIRNLSLNGMVTHSAAVVRGPADDPGHRAGTQFNRKILVWVLAWKITWLFGLRFQTLRENVQKWVVN